MDEKFTVEFYETEKGERPSLDFINTGLTNMYCHAELDSASTLYTVHRFRNEFGMTLRNELFGQPLYYFTKNYL